MHLPRRPRPRKRRVASELPAAVIDISAELFPGPLEVHLEFDPELPNKKFVVLTVRASGKPKDLVRRRLAWHRRVSEAVPETNIRLCITQK